MRVCLSVCGDRCGLWICHGKPTPHAVWTRSRSLASQFSQVFRSSHNFTTRVTQWSRASARSTVASRKFGKFNPAQRARHHEECQLRAREAAPSAREAAVAKAMTRPPFTPTTTAEAARRGLVPDTRPDTSARSAKQRSSSLGTRLEWATPPRESGAAIARPNGRSRG